MHEHVLRHLGLGGKGLEAYGAAVLVREVHQVSVLDHPAGVDKYEVALGAADVEGLLLVDELHMLPEVVLSVGLVAAYVADELEVMERLVAKSDGTT